MRKRNKQLASELIYNQYFNRVPVNMMKLNEVCKKIEAIIAEGLSETERDTKFKALVEEYREPGVA